MTFAITEKPCRVFRHVHAQPGGGLVFHGYRTEDRRGTVHSCVARFAGRVTRAARDSRRKVFINGSTRSESKVQSVEIETRKSGSSICK